MDLVTVIILAVGGTTLPLFLDTLRTFVPQRLRYGRLVAAWHRQVLMCLVCGACAAPRTSSLFFFGVREILGGHAKCILREFVP